MGRIVSASSVVRSFRPGDPASGGFEALAGFLGVLIFGELGPEFLVGLGGLFPLVELLVDLAGFEEGDGLPLGGVVLDDDPVIIFERFLVLLLVEIGLASHELGPGSEFAAFTGGEHQVEGLPGFFEEGEPLRGSTSGVVDFGGEGVVGVGGLESVCGGDRVFPPAELGEALDSAGLGGRGEPLEVGLGRRFGGEGRELGLAPLASPDLKVASAFQKRASRR